jgi:hypothetical protein
MAKCGKRRPQIATELSVRVGRSVTVSILNDWTKTTKTSARFPAAYVRVFCEIIGNDELQRVLLSPRLLDMIEVAECELKLEENRTAKDNALGRLTGPDAKKSRQKEGRSGPQKDRR